MICYLCKSKSFVQRSGKVRDNNKIKVFQCRSCGLVALGSVLHIGKEFYEKSGMHGQNPLPIDLWLKETDQDNERRVQTLKGIIINKKVLDFGCGAGGFLLKAQPYAAEVSGVELERRVIEAWQGRLKIFPSLTRVKEKYDLITAFHVVEHLAHPIIVLKELSKRLGNNGQIVVEVPNADDGLITLFNCEAFQNFTYWSQHLYLYNANTLRLVAEKSGLKVLTIQHIQRYPLSNHLHWLSLGKAGGHKNWGFLDSPSLNEAYASSLAGLGKTDTLMAYLGK